MSKKLNRGRTKKAYKFANSGKTTKRNRLLHFMRRFQERHGYILSSADVDEIRSQIRNNTAELISWSNKSFVYKVNCRDLQIAVVIAPCKKELITTFKLEPKHYEMIELNKQKLEQKKRQQLAIKDKRIKRKQSIFITIWNKLCYVISKSNIIIKGKPERIHNEYQV